MTKVSKAVKAEMAQQNFNKLYADVSVIMINLYSDENITYNAKVEWYVGQFSVSKSFQNVYTGENLLNALTAIHTAKRPDYTFNTAYLELYIAEKKVECLTIRTYDGYEVINNNLDTRLKVVEKLPVESIEDARKRYRCGGTLTREEQIKVLNIEWMSKEQLDATFSYAWAESHSSGEYSVFDTLVELVELLEKFS